MSRSDVADTRQTLELHVALGGLSADPLLSRVQRAVFAGFRTGHGGLPAVARATGMSIRTLRRRLTERGTSYQGLVDELRRDLACARLRHSDDSVARIADFLGFASVSAFQRAFQRWTGLTASSYRERERAKS